MPLPRRKMFGWHDDRRRVYFLSDVPPDGPIRPALSFSETDGFSAEDALATYLKRKRIDVIWLPPLTGEQTTALAKAQMRLKAA
jgi:hypothetical protein